MSKINWVEACPEIYRAEISESLRLKESISPEADKRVLSQIWGEYAEAIACCYLLENGFPIRDKNWRPDKRGSGPCKGEIDIISEKGSRIIFVEVKARLGEKADPWKMITPQKINRLCRGADIYLKRLSERREYQFDIILITGNFNNYKIEHISDAFMAPLQTRP